MLKKIENLIISIEESKTPLVFFIFTFFSFLTLRNFIEVFSTDGSIALMRFFHYYISYILLASFLIILTYILTKTPIIKVTKVILVGFIIVPLPPILDLIITKGKGVPITYLIPGTHDDLIWRFFTFFGNFEHFGPSLGIRIEIALVLIAIFFYFFVKNRDLIKSLLFTFFFYSVIFILFTVPFIAKGILGLFNIEYDRSDRSYLNFYVLGLTMAGVLIMYYFNKYNFIKIIKDIRPLRTIYYILMFILGLMIANLTNNFILDSNNIFIFIFIPLSIIFAWLFSVVTNNIADYEIDKISNQDRPLVSSRIDIKTYQKLAIFFFVAACFYASLVSFKALFLILLFIGIYFIYSMPPLRFKRIPFFSKLAISFNSLIMVLLGFIAINGTRESFPLIIVPIFLIGVTALANFIDIKDYEGDKRAGIKTLPTILGLKKSKLVISIFFVILYASFYPALKFANLPLSWMWFFILLGGLQFFFINIKNYKDKYILLLCLITVLGIMFLLNAINPSLMKSKSLIPLTSEKLSEESKKYFLDY